ncbi:hypothetical protein Ptr902_09025 [Pyrenophora tritici-repentis]|nr:hypothetical protein Ptr902_09025 [Pyrenophora tritici-repentis]
MLASKPTIVSLPYVTFSQRHKDTNKQHCIAAQLRKQARAEGLNVSCLIEKREIIHVLIEQQKYGGAKPHIENTVDTKRHTFFDLPGEIRNKIYNYLLYNERLIVVRHQGLVPFTRKVMVFPLTMHYMVAQSRKPPPEKKQIPDSRVTQLLNTSWANRELHQEYRSYFLANHMFHVVGPNGAPYIDFFDQIGPIARASIADVVLDNSNFWSYNGLHYWMPYLAGLHTLNIYMHLGHLVHIDVYILIRAYVLGDTIRCEEF